MELTLEEKIVYALDKIRPYIQRDGGDVQFVSVTPQGVVTVRLHGACIGCGLADMTVKGGIEAILTDEIPEVSEVVMEEDYANM